MVHCPLTELMLITFLFMEVESDAPTATIRTKGQCTCITNDGAEYNLMPLGRSDGIPRYHFVHETFALLIVPHKRKVYTNYIQSLIIWVETLKRFLLPEASENSI